MKVLTCAATRRRLHAYHDEELPIHEQVDVAAHLEWCDRCALSLAELQLLRAALRSAVSGRRAMTTEEDDRSFHASVVSRARVEATVSFRSQLRERFDDMHYVYAGFGAAMATVVCLMSMLSMMRFATSESPGSNENPMVVDARMLLPRALDQVFLTPPGSDKSSDEAAFTLSAVVTREGRILNLELHSESGETLPAGSSQAHAAENLMGAVSRARFEPARVGGLPVAVNMVWLIAHTTVRAVQTPLSQPPVKKRRVVGVSARNAVARRTVV